MDEQGVLLVCIYMDDVIYMGSFQTLINYFKEGTKKTFEMTDLGKLQYFLGLESTQTKHGVFISQQRYAKNLLKKFNMQECNVVSTSVNAKEKLHAVDGSGSAEAKRYRSLIGGLHYLSHTRLDIMYAVGLVSRFMSNPSKHHLEAAKRILRYIAGTLNYGLWFKASVDVHLIGYTDSDWASSSDD